VVVGYRRPLPIAAEKGGGTAIIGGGTFAGRSDPEGPVDRITVSDGRWWQRPGEIVVSQSLAQISQVGVGSTIVLRTAPVDSGKSKDPAPGAGIQVGPSSPSPSDAGGSAPVQRSFSVVGIAASISTPGVFGWLNPTDLAALAPSATLEEMLYRVAPAATDADIAAGVTAITAGLPPTAVASTGRTCRVAWTSIGRRGSSSDPLAFSLFALLAAAFVIANLVAGSSSSATARSGS
jgi:putative ABC transport system permease protein